MTQVSNDLELRALMFCTLKFVSDENLEQLHYSLWPKWHSDQFDVELSWINIPLVVSILSFLPPYQHSPLPSSVRFITTHLSYNVFS